MTRLFLPQFGGRELANVPYHGRVVPRRHAHKFTFAVVRNPYERMKSIYRHLRHASDPRAVDGMEAFIDRFTKTPDWMNQVEFLDAARIDAALRYERLREEVVELPFNRQRIGLPAERLNASPDDIGAPETPAFIEAVNHHSAPVFKEFGYEMRQA